MEQNPNISTLRLTNMNIANITNIRAIKANRILNMEDTKIKVTPNSITISNHHNNSKL